MMSDSPEMLTQRTTLEVFNQDDVPLLMFLEPWAEFFLIPPGTAVDIIAFAPADGELEIDDTENRLTIWGWTGSTVHVLRDGQELEPIVLTSAEAATICRRRRRAPVLRHRSHSA